MKVIVNKMAIEYDDQGAGPVVLMLHGWKDTLHTFDELARELVGYRIVRVDMPGFGLSDMPLNPDWHVADYSSFVAALTEKLQIEPYAIIGHSFGGRVAIKGIASAVLTARKLVLIASAGIAQRMSARSVMLGVLARSARMLAYVPGFGSTYNTLRQRAYRRIGSDYYDAGGMRAVFLNAIREDLSDAARSIKIPTLLIWGERDTQTSLHSGMRLRELISGSRIVVCPGADHFVHREYPALVGKEIREFL